MNNKIRCLQRYNEITFALPAIIDFLVEHRLMNDDDQRNCKLSPVPETFVYLFLEELKKNEKLIALLYEWTILPSEYIDITIGVPSDYRVFSTKTI